MTKVLRPTDSMLAEATPRDTRPSPLSDEEAHQLDLKIEQEARRQARVGQIVRGDRG